MASKAAQALASIFASLPLAGKLFWAVGGSTARSRYRVPVHARGERYLYFVGRDRRPQSPDSAAILDKALQLTAVRWELVCHEAFTMRTFGVVLTAFLLAQPASRPTSHSVRR